MERGFGIGCYREVGQSRENLLDTDVELQACEIGAEAPMHACSESKMPIRLAVKDTAIGVGEFVGVTIRRGVVDDDRFAGAEGVPAQLDIPSRQSGGYRESSLRSG